MRPDASEQRRQKGNLSRFGTVAELDAVVRKLLTDVVEATGLDPMPHLAALDPVRAMDLVRRRLGDR